MAPSPDRPVGNYTNPVQAFWRLRRDHPQWWQRTPAAAATPRPWPGGIDPSLAAVFARNEATLPLPPSEVFLRLRRASEWPRTYPNAYRPVVEDPTGLLSPGTRFTWTTFGVRQRSQVLEYEEDRVLAWNAVSPGTVAIHRWLLEPHEGGTRVVTEEIQQGPTSRVIRPLMQPGLHAAHQTWLQALAAGR